MVLIAVLLVAAMSLMIDGNDAGLQKRQPPLRAYINGPISGDLSAKELQQRCQSSPQAVFAHPGECQLYYNCSAAPDYLEECLYPRLFSTVTSRCESFDDVTCGDRRELVDCHQYHRFQCTVNRPSCKGLPDGKNAWEDRPDLENKQWDTKYMVCRSQRLQGPGFCQRHSILEITQLFDPYKRRCVSLYEVPKTYGGLDCTRKADGDHLDDVTFRPFVYYTCKDGELVSVDRCDSGEYFDEDSKACAEKPGKNTIMGIGV